MTDLSEQLVDGINETYGVHPGHRAVHAKGVLCAGTFTPTPETAELSRAPHFAGPPTRAHVRFSNGSGNPTLADSVRDARGIGIKLYLPDGATTDIVGISLPAFFARTPEDLLAFNKARRPAPTTGEVDVEKVGAYLAEHAEAITAVTAAMTHIIPASYATLTYHALHAYGFVGGDGTVRHARYHVVPAAGEVALSDDAAAAKSPDYLAAEITERLAAGAVSFALNAQLAAAGDPIDDPTVVWPDDREVVHLGRLDVTNLADDRDVGDDILVFDPTRVPDGITLTDDAILRARPGAYAVSVARRTGPNRAARRGEGAHTSQ
jgi:catalase